MPDNSKFLDVENDEYYIQLQLLNIRSDMIGIEISTKEALKGIKLNEIEEVFKYIGKWEKLTSIAKILFNEITS